MTQTTKNNLLLGVCVLLKLVLQYYMVAAGFELHRDEFLHLDQAHHLAWGYTSIPPATSWVSSLILLLGNGVFWVRFFPALFGALTLIVVWKSIEALNGGWFACVLGAAAFIFSGYLRMGILYQPNALDILCWSLVFFCLVKHIQTNKTGWLYALAVSFALGILNKYNIGFLLMGLLPALLLTKQRVLFKKRELYFAMGLGLLIILPNLIWQYQNGFPVFTHMQQLASTQLVNQERMGFLSGQLSICFSSLFVLVIAFIGFAVYKPFRPYRVIGWCYLFVILLFTFLQGKAYYAFGLYPVLLAFGAVYTEWLTRRSWRRYLRYAAMVIIVGIGAVMIPATCPIFSPDKIMADEGIRNFYTAVGQSKWEDGQQHAIPQDYADMIGWKELGGVVDSALKTLSEAERAQTLIMCDNYGHAGAVNYYVKPYPQACSFSADYANWLPEADKTFKAVILVKYGPIDNLDEEFAQSGLPFTSAAFVGSVRNPMARIEGTSVYLLRHPSVPFNSADIGILR